jgi:pyruvate formate lyase activating enzyme
MKIAGIQGLTLIDYPEKLACTLFFYYCNFRCGFCHNPELVLKNKREIYSEKEVLNFLEKRKKYLEGICITGGEPLINLDKEFLKKIKKIGYLIKLDTNGCFPKKLKELINENLIDFVSMDLKNSKEKYSKTAGVKVDIKKIEESMKIICCLKNYEFRTTIVEDLHKEEEIKEIGELINKVCGKKPKKYFLQGFKNSGKFIDENYKFKADTNEKYLNKLKKISENYFENVGIRI